MRWTANILASAMFLFALGLNGSDIGLPSFVTAKRIGLALLTAGIVIIPYKRWYLPWVVRRIAWVLVGIGLWGMVSTLWNATDLVRGINLSLGWFFTAYAILAATILLVQIIPSYKQIFLNKMAFLGSIAPILVIAFIITKQGPNIFYNFFTLRLYLDAISIGMSRLMNGLLFLSIVPLGILTGCLPSKKWTYTLCLAGMGSFMFLALISGSRQTVGALGLILLVMISVNFVSNKVSKNTQPLSRHKQWVLVGILLLGLSLLIYGIFSQRVFQENVERRFVKSTTAQLEEGQIRLVIARATWKLAFEYPILGVGPGEFAENRLNPTGHPPHNGYLGILVEYGFIPLIVLILLLAGNLLDALRHRQKAFLRKNGDLLKLSFSFCLVFSTWIIIFNDLSRENFVWIFLVMMILSSRWPISEEGLGVKNE